MFDAHCHLQFDAFDDIDVVGEAKAEGVSGIVSCDFDSRTRERLCRIADTSGVWATFGLHPWALPADSGELERELSAVEEAAESGGWVGVGEFGLDATRRADVPMSTQVRVVEQHLEIAAAQHLPVVLHIVRAEREMIEVLDRVGKLAAGGMCHGFSGTPEEANEFIDRGLHISIGTGAVRGNVGRVREVCRAIPRAWMLVETDAPSRPPDGVDAPNHPRYLHRVIDAIASFVDAAPELIAEVTEENTRRLFQLGSATL